jgi:hypothetical protein
MSSYNRNPMGINQHNLGEHIVHFIQVVHVLTDDPIAGADDPTLKAALEKYHRENITDAKKISMRLNAEYGIKMR